MELFERKITYDSTTTPFHIVFTGDWHLGHGGCDKKKIAATIEHIKQLDNVLVVHMGDLMECISPTDPRFDAYSMDSKFLPDLGRLIDRQYEEVKSLLMPIRDKILLIHEGNHEQKIRKQYFRDVVLDLCRELRHGDNVYPRYGHTVAITRLRFEHRSGGKTRTFNILTCHGYGGGKKKGSKVNSLSDLAGDYKNVDIFAAGHTHSLFIIPHIKLGLNSAGKLRLSEENTWLINTGSYVKTYEQHVVSYTETNMYPPSPLGCAAVRIYPATRTIEGYYIS